MKKPFFEELQVLKKTVDTIYSLPENDWDAFAACWQRLSIGKQQTLTVAGSVERNLYFVIEGTQRIFSLDDKDREATLLFTYPPSFGGVIDSLFMQKPSRYYFETLSASVLLVLPYNKFITLMEESKAINTFVAKSLIMSLSGLLERLTELQSLSSEEKFKKLLQRSPHILQLIPQKYLANYIGIDATNFSKLMNKVKI
ncbi:MAG: Crp/Fnr family transcriptional regulator [Chitinophagaceae bacterium]